MGLLLGQKLTFLYFGFIDMYLSIYISVRLVNFDKIRDGIHFAFVSRTMKTKIFCIQQELIKCIDCEYLCLGQRPFHTSNAFHQKIKILL